MPVSSRAFALRAALLACSVALGGCPQTRTFVDPACVVQLTVPDVAVAPGDTVTATATPVTSVFDTRITVDGSLADITDATRTDCDTCDTCRAAEGCASCEACDNCTDLCAECTESVTFTVPDVDDGTHPVLMLNQFGISDPAPLSVDSALGDTD